MKDRLIFLILIRSRIMALSIKFISHAREILRFAQDDARRGIKSLLSPFYESGDRNLTKKRILKYAGG